VITSVMACHVFVEGQPCW